MLITPSASAARAERRHRGPRHGPGRARDRRRYPRQRRGLPISLFGALRDEIIDTTLLVLLIFAVTETAGLTWAPLSRAATWTPWTQVPACSAPPAQPVGPAVTASGHRARRGRERHPQAGQPGAPAPCTRRRRGRKRTVRRGRKRRGRNGWSGLGGVLGTALGELPPGKGEPVSVDETIDGRPPAADRHGGPGRVGGAGQSGHGDEQGSEASYHFLLSLFRGLTQWLPSATNTKSPFA